MLRGTFDGGRRRFVSEFVACTKHQSAAPSCIGQLPETRLIKAACVGDTSRLHKGKIAPAVFLDPGAETGLVNQATGLPGVIVWMSIVSGGSRVDLGAVLCPEGEGPFISREVLI